MPIARVTDCIIHPLHKEAMSCSQFSQSRLRSCYRIVDNLVAALNLRVNALWVAGSAKRVTFNLPTFNNAYTRSATTTTRSAATTTARRPRMITG
jgi:hypothetical protein